MGFSLFEIPIYSFPFPITLYFKKKKKNLSKSLLLNSSTGGFCDIFLPILSTNYSAVNFFYTCVLPIIVNRRNLFFFFSPFYSSTSNLSKKRFFNSEKTFFLLLYFILFFLVKNLK